MQRLEVSGAVQPLYESLGVKVLNNGYWVSFPGVKWLDVALATHLHLAPRLETFDCI